VATPLNWEVRLQDKFSPAARKASDATKALADRIKKLKQEQRDTAKDSAALAKLAQDAEKAAKARTAAEQREADRRAQIRLREERDEQRSANAVLRTRRAAARADSRRQTEGTNRATQGRERSREALMGLGGLAGAGLTALGGYGDTLRERRQTLNTLDYQIQQLASGDVGDAGSSRAIRESVRRTSLDTGLNATDVLAGVSEAQGSFSMLGTAQSRAEFLTTTLPALSRAAVGTGTPLVNMVGTVGELQRQLGVRNAQLPDTVARLIELGRRGSVTFQSMSSHLGELGGMTARFVRTGTEAESQSAVGLTGGLFQLAGQAGGGGDRAATRLRGFLNNLTSRRGQQRLNSALGANAFDRTGQLRTADGMSQTESFASMVEAIYRRTGGNSERFLTALAGTDSEGRVLGDQIFQGLRSNQGRATKLRSMTTLSTSATAANTTDRAFQDVVSTQAGQDARRENRQLFESQTSQMGVAAEQTRQQLDQLRDSSGFLASVLDNQLSRGVMDFVNAQFGGPTVGGTARQGPARTRMDLLRDQARAIASQEYDGGVTGFFRNLSTPTAVRNRIIDGQTEEVLARLVAQQRAAGRDPNAPLRIAPESTAAIGNAVAEAQAGNTAPGGPGTRSTLGGPQ